jgi:bacterial/archaeal transporter family protein
MSITLLSILAGVGGLLGWGIYDFLGGVFTKQIGPLKSFFWSQLAGFISTILLLFVFSVSLNLPILILILLPGAAVIYSAGYLLFFKGFEIGNVSIVAATMNLWAVFTMLFAFIFLGQRLTGIQSLGVFMILCGVTLASLDWNDIRNQRFQLSAGVKEAVLGAFSLASFGTSARLSLKKLAGCLRLCLLSSGLFCSCCSSPFS